MSPSETSETPETSLRVLPERKRDFERCLSGAQKPVGSRDNRNHKNDVDDCRQENDPSHRLCPALNARGHQPLILFIRKMFSRSISSRRNWMNDFVLFRRGMTLNSSAFTRLLVFSISLSIFLREVSNSATSMIFTTTSSYALAASVTAAEV